MFVLEGASVSEDHAFTAENVNRIKGESRAERIERVLSRWQGKSLRKEARYRILSRIEDNEKLYKRMKLLGIPKVVVNAVREELESE